jgi:hypothetical protein
MSASTQEQEVELFDPFNILHIQEPFPFFARLREEQANIQANIKVCP